MNTKTMHVFSSRAPFNDLPEDVLHKIDEHLKNYNAYEKRVNEYVSRYGDMLPNNERNRLINEINTEIRNYQNELITKRELDDAIDAIIGDRGMGGKKRTKRTKRTKRAKRTNRTYKRRK